MKKSWRSIALAILALCPSASIASDTYPEFSKSVDQAVTKSKIDAKGLAMHITAADGRVILDKNSGRSLIPASLTKIVTAAALLEEFPIGHQFETELYGGAAVTAGVLKGDLYLKGGGDPGFVSESMWLLVNDFLRTGVKKVEGNIVVDDGKFDTVRFDESREQSRVDRAYDAPIGAMTFNWSAVNVYARPSDGGKAAVFVDPENDYILLENSARTVARGKTSLQVTSKGIKGNKEVISVSGQIAQGEKEKVFYKSVVRPELWAGENFKKFLERRGVTVTGQVKTGSVPRSARLLTTQKGKPIADLVSSMMKFSNNYIAEILVKNLGAEKAGRPGTLNNGVAAIRGYMSRIGIPADAFTVENPSGLSRSNRLRAKDIVKVLNRLANNFRLFPEFLSGFPIAGVDGTLKSRLKDANITGNIRAKTGHLSGVSGLAGYAGGTSGQVYEFAFIYNGSDKDAWRAKDLFDEVLKILLKSDQMFEEQRLTRKE